jgi:sigma-E factor negative regulatory protein RseC
MAGEQDRSSIEHKGIVEEVTEGTVKVNLLNVDSCAACHAKAGCGVSAVDRKIIEITDTTGTYAKGDQVKVSLEHGVGARALILGYVLPFFVLLVSLIVSWTITGNEVLSAGIALGSLVPYYVVLAFFREQLKQTFSFRISRI